MTIISAAFAIRFNSLKVINRPGYNYFGDHNEKLLIKEFDKFLDKYIMKLTDLLLL